MNLILNRIQKKAILLALVVSFTVPVIFTPTVKADYLEQHTGYLGHFQGKEQVLWWQILKIDVRMWVSADIWYSSVLMGWYLKNIYWYFPIIQSKHFLYVISHVTILNEYTQAGPYFIEVSQTIELKVSKGSSYRWITFELVMNPGDGDGDADVDYTLGSGNLILIWSKRVIRTNDILGEIADHEQGWP